MSHWKQIEAVLFASSKYTSIDDIMAYTDLNKKQVKEGVKKLIEHYKNADSSLDIFEDEEGYKLNVKEKYSQTIQNVVYDAELPKHIMETLSLIAYKTPVLQSEIIKRRGQHAYDHINYLEKKKFIKKEPEGRSYKLKVTDKFHEYFDLNEPGLRDLFKNIEEPDHMGNLEVYETNQEEKDEFDTQVLDRLKKANKVKIEDEEDYLNEFDNRINELKEKSVKDDELEEKDSSEKEELTSDEDEAKEDENSEANSNEEDETSLNEDNNKNNLLNQINKDIDELTNENSNSEKKESN